MSPYVHHNILVLSTEVVSKNMRQRFSVPGGSGGGGGRTYFKCVIFSVNV